MGCGCGKKHNTNPVKNKVVDASLPVVGSSPEPYPVVRNSISSSPNYYSKYRTNVCASCEFNKGGICEKIAERSNSYRAQVLNGVTRKSLACPIGKWPAIAIECPLCSRLEVIPERYNICNQCRQKKSSGNIRNLNAKSKKHLCYLMDAEDGGRIGYHLNRIIRESDTFDGQSICFFTTKDQDIIDRYTPALEKYFDSIIFSKRNIYAMLGEMDIDYQYDVICFAHSKIFSDVPEVNNFVTDVMYETVFHNWDEIYKAMGNKYYCAGAFQDDFNGNQNKWSFSGGFFWARAFYMARKNWHIGGAGDFGQYLGHHFKKEESYCTFGDGYNIRTADHNTIMLDIAADFKKWKQ